MTARRKGKRELVTIYWRDIPAQVVASSGSETERLLLTPRFQNAIDRSAGVAGLTEADDYVAQWRRTACRIEGEVSVMARSEVERLEEAYPRERLESLVRQGGTEPNVSRDQTI